MKAAVLMVVLMALMLCSTTSATLAPMPQYNGPVPPCLDKLSTCYKNVNYTKMFESTNPNDTVPCCTEWADEIKGNLQCICDYLGENMEYFVDVFKLCKLDASADTLCQDVSKNGNGGASANSQGNGANNIAFSVGLFPLLLLILTLIFKF